MEKGYKVDGGERRVRKKKRRTKREGFESRDGSQVGQSEEREGGKIGRKEMEG